MLFFYNICFIKISKFPTYLDLPGTRLRDYMRLTDLLSMFFYFSFPRDYYDTEDMHNFEMKTKEIQHMNNIVL